MQLIFALVLLLSALPALAGDIANATPEPGTAIVAEGSPPDLLRLEQTLTLKQEEKKAGRVTPEQYQQWEGKFRAQLDATMARVPPSPDNTAAHVRITAQLGERAQAREAVDRALGQNPESPILLRTKGHILYEQNDFPGAAENALQAWEKSGHTDKASWALYQMSKGRRAPSGTDSASPELSPQTHRPPVVSADRSSKPIKLAIRGGEQAGAVPLPAQVEAEPSQRKGGLPLWPLAVPVAGGLIAYGLYRGAKQTESQEVEPPPTEAFIVAGPVLATEPAKIAGGVAQAVARGTAVKTLGGIAITGVAAASILVAGGTALIVTVNHGLNEVVSAQDKYNEAIDTHRNDQRRSMQPTRATQIKEDPEYSNPQREREYRRAKGFCESEPPLGDDECSNLSKLIDHAKKCIELYDNWDARWQPGRHEPKLGTWRKRLQNLKGEHRRRCTEK